MAEIRNLSVSKIEAALLCPRAFKYQYLDRIPQPAVGRMVAGQVVHEVLEFALTEFARTGTYPDSKTLDDLFVPTWEKKVKEEEEKESFIGWQWDEPEEKAKEGYRPLVRLAREEVLPTLKPWMAGGKPVVEWKINLELRSDIGNFPLIGYIDLLEESGVLADWKTTENKVSARAKKTWLQFAAYSLWAYPLVGNEILKCEKIFLVKADVPFVERVQFEVGPAHRKYFVEVAAQVWKLIKYGIYLPNTEVWKCNPKFCAFWAGCQGSVVKAVPPEELVLEPEEAVGF